MKRSYCHRYIRKKWPKRCEENLIVDSELKAINVGLLKFNDERFVTYKQSILYTVPMQIYMSGTSECALFIFSPIKNSSFLSIFKVTKVS